MIDATGNLNTGTLFALEAMRHGELVVMLNVEADITIGRFLKEEARNAGRAGSGGASADGVRPHTWSLAEHSPATRVTG